MCARECSITYMAERTRRGYHCAMTNALRTATGLWLWMLVCMLLAATLVLLSLPGCTSSQLDQVKTADAAAQTVCDAVVLASQNELALPAEDVALKVCRDRAVKRRLLLFILAEARHEVERLRHELPKLQGSPYGPDAGPPAH